MKLQFEVGSAAPSKTEIERIKTKAGAIARLLGWLSFVDFPIAFYAGWKVAVLFISPSVAALPFLPWMISIVPGVLAGSMVSIVIIGSVTNWQSYWRDMEKGLEPIDVGLAEKAISLAAAYPEIETYRQFIVLQRQITNFDFDAMRCFAEAADQSKRAQALREKQEDSFRRLHNVASH